VFLTIILTVVCPGGFSFCAGVKPNIILVMADDQGWGDMAYYGDPVLKTPNFDEAAATGLRFDHFYAAAPVCSPTRASVMTGRNPNRMGVYKWGYPMRPQETTLPEALKSAGYTTAHFGKWHLGSVRNQSPVNPGKNGFDYWVSAPNFYDNDAIMSVNGKAVPMKGESSFIAVDAALAWLGEKVKEDAPIFAVVWFGSPHQPHKAAEEYAALYKDQPKKRQQFLGEISGMDAAFGKLRDALTTLGIRDNTLLWYNSDNGGLKNIGNVGGLRGYKGLVYDGGLQVPAILEWPAKIKKHRVTELRCVTSDIYPTLLEIAGVTIPKQPPLDGVSLVPLIEGKPFQRSKPIGFWNNTEPGIVARSAEWMKELYEAQQTGGDLPPTEKINLHAGELPDPPYPSDKFPGHAAWIDGDWKLHRITPKKGNGTIKWELYNLADDRAEKIDLIKREPERAAQMKAALNAWLKSVVGSLNGADY